MNGAIERFGRIVSDAAEKNPARARSLLCTAFGGYALSKRLPGGKALPARKEIAVSATRHVIQGLKHPENTAIVNVFLPCEPLYAMGISPQFPEGMSCFLSATASETAFIEAAERGGVPESLCSYHKVLVGLAACGVMPRPQVILNTTLACDANQVSFRRTAEYYDAPQFVVDVPYDASEDAVLYVAAQLREMVRFIEAHTPFRLEEETLRTAMKRSRNTLTAYRAYLDARSTRFVPDEMTNEMYSIFATHVMLGSEMAESYTRRLAEETHDLPERRPAKRLIWAHTLPFWQDSMRELVNYNETCEIIACDMNFDLDALPDPDKPYESMACRLLSSVFNGSSVRRIEKMAQMAGQMHADGVVWFNHWGCKQTLGAAQLAKQTLEAQGIPVLLLDGDGCDRSNINDGQMRTRLQAFLEQLEGRR